MSGHREWNLASKVYIGNLGDEASKEELEEVFARYGRISSIWVARNPPGFAFVEFNEERDAEAAVRALDGSRVCGTRVTVEMSSGKSRGANKREDRGGGFGDSSRGREDGGGGFGRDRRDRGERSSRGFSDGGGGRRPGADRDGRDRSRSQSDDRRRRSPRY